jgi:hypothetical protein
MIPFVPCQPLAITLGASLGRINLGISHLCRGWWVKQTTLAGRIAPLKNFNLWGQCKNRETMLLALIALARLAPFFPLFFGRNLLCTFLEEQHECHWNHVFVLATVLKCLVSKQLYQCISGHVGGNQVFQATNCTTTTTTLGCV